MKPCFGYIRVSTQKQGEGVSLEAQKDAITAFASRHNLAILEWFEEKETAAKSGRPIFNRMLKLLERGKAQGLIIHKIDRSARNLKDWAVKAGRGKKRSKRHHHLYRGLVRCGLCAAALSPELQKGRVYYRCQSKGCPTTTIREDRLDAEIGQFLATFQPSEEDTAWLRAEFRGWLDGDEQAEALQALDLQIAQAETRLERLTDLLIDGAIGQDDFNRRKQRLLLEIAELRQNRADHQQNRFPPGDMEKFLELMKNLAELHRLARPEEKRQLVENCFSNRVLIEKELAVEPANWLSEIGFDHDGQSGPLHRTRSRTSLTNPMVREGIRKLIQIFEREIGYQHNLMDEQSHSEGRTPYR